MPAPAPDPEPAAVSEHKPEPELEPAAIPAAATPVAALVFEKLDSDHDGVVASRVATRVTWLLLETVTIFLVPVPAPQSHCQYTASPQCELN